MCPHCNHVLRKWPTPAASSWGEGIQYICCNDDCPYYKKGWDWMMSQFNTHASYRHRFDPVTGETGPIPVWSKDALMDQIIQDD